MLAAQEVSKSYRRTKALDRVSCDFVPGVTGVLGPNGAGKTTFLRCLATTLHPDEGAITYKGHILTAKDALGGYRSELGYVPQELGVLPKMEVRQFVEYIAIARRREWPESERRRAVDAALEQVGLSDRATAGLRTLSGGMKQRALLAQALVTQPKVLILDEPTVGLDPQQRSLFRSLLVELAKERTVILSTHLIEDIQSLDARILVLDRGQSAFIGSLTELANIARGRVTIVHAAPRAGRYWQHSGTYRVVGPTAEATVEPLPEDGYLDLVGQNPQEFDIAPGIWGMA